MYGVVTDRSKLEQLLLRDVSWLNASERQELLSVYFGDQDYASWPTISGPQRKDELDEGQFPDYEISYNRGNIAVRNLTSVDHTGPFYGLTTDEVWMEC